MTGPTPSRHLRAYRVMLLLLPRWLRRRYGAEMEQLFDAMWRQQRSSARGVSSAVFWLGALSDVWREASQARLRHRRAPRAHSRFPVWTPSMDHLRADLRFARTQLRRNPGFAAVAVLTLALGVGATTSVFSIADAVVLRPLPYPAAGRLVAVYESDLATGDERDTFAGATFIDWRASSSSFEELAAYRTLAWTLTGEEVPRRVNGVSVTPNFFAVFGVEAGLGRVFSPAADPPGGASVAVISYAMWQRDYTGDTDVLGQRLTLNGEPYTIVGVAPPAFGFPLRPDSPVEVWTAAHTRVPDAPIDLGGDPAENRGAGYLSAVARLADGVTIDEAQAEMSLIAERLAREYPDTNDGEGVNIVPLREAISGDAAPLLLVLLSAVGLVLLIACSNVANLMLAKASRRRQEIALRGALGAGRGRILAQLLTESVVLAGLGGLLGVLLARFGIDALLAIAPIGLPGAESASLDLRVLSFAFVAVLGAGVIFGLAPAYGLLGVDLQRAVREGAGGATSRRGQRRLGRALIVAEVSLSLLLVIGAGLMGRTFLTLAAVEPGFDPSDTLVAHVALPDSKYSEDQQVVAMFDRVVGTLRETPGIESAGSVLTLPMHWGLRGTLLVNIEGRGQDDEQDTLAGFQLVTPGYFRTLRIPLIRGRLLAESDTAEAPSVALINEAFAAKYFSGEDPLGKRVTWGDPENEEDWTTIVGIVQDVHLEGLDATAMPETYLPYAQAAMPYTTFVVRSTLDRAELAKIVRQAVLDADPDQPITGVATMEEVLRESLSDRRFNMVLLGSFALGALFMAAIGLYGVLSFSVAQRTREIGLRRALGAQQAGVIRLVAGEGLRLVGVGMALGIVAAIVLGRFITGQLYGVQPTDPLILLVSGTTIAVVALLATFAPAYRAARTDPMIALRRQ